MSRTAEMSERRALGTRGKYAEDKVRDELRKRSADNARFDFERNYDGRSSMGRIPARGGDFTFYVGTDANGEGEIAHGLIEVKQVAHDCRLPRRNFDPDKFGILRKREMAGGKIVIIVYHSTIGKWRCPPFGWFVALKDNASWDLTTWPTFNTVREVLDAAGLF
jgi:hypothetical protein